MPPRTNLFSTTYITLPDGEEIEAKWEFTPYDPGVSTGPVEACYPASGGECLSCKLPGITDDGETWLTRSLGNLAYAQLEEEAFVQAEMVERDPDRDR